MLIKTLGTLDIISALMLLLVHFHLLPFKIYILVFFYILIKGLSFYKNVHGTLDVMVALFSLLMFFGANSIIDYVVIIYLLQKGIYSLL